MITFYDQPHRAFRQEFKEKEFKDEIFTTGRKSCALENASNTQKLQPQSVSFLIFF